MGPAPGRGTAAPGEKCQRAQDVRSRCSVFKVRRAPGLLHALDAASARPARSPGSSHRVPGHGRWGGPASQGGLTRSERAVRPQAEDSQRESLQRVSRSSRRGFSLLVGFRPRSMRARLAGRRMRPSAGSASARHASRVRLARAAGYGRAGFSSIVYGARDARG